MKLLVKTILSILFALVLVEIWMLLKVYAYIRLTWLGWVLLTIAAAILYYFIFERKKRR